MEKLKFDTGVRSYKIGSGVLRFNPADPNLYSRFQKAVAQLEALKINARNEDFLDALCDADRQVKAILGEVFGPENDMDAIFSGMNLLAVGDNGQRLLANFLAAIEPILSDGARACAAAEVADL